MIRVREHEGGAATHAGTSRGASDVARLEMEARQESQQLAVGLACACGGACGCGKSFPAFSIGERNRNWIESWDVI